MPRAETDAGLSPREAAERTGLSVEALRYYEREGLIRPVRRTAGGRRSYTADDIAWIGLITCLRAAGLGIADLREFTVLLRDQGGATERAEFLQVRREVLRQRQQAIATAIAVLDEKIEHFSR